MFYDVEIDAQTCFHSSHYAMHYAALVSSHEISLLSPSVSATAEE